MRGVSFTFKEKALTLDITADAQLLPPNIYDLRSERRKGAYASNSSSAFLNYALTGTTGNAAPSSGLAFAAEAGVRWGDYLFLSDASEVETTAGQRFVRLMSSITHDDRQNLRRITIGDHLTATRDFSSGINLGGIGITETLTLRPTPISCGFPRRP